jgi:hypothetical protein
VWHALNVTLEISMASPDTTELQQATIALNQAIDAYWNDAIDAYWNDNARGLGLTGMGEHHMIRITDAQRRCRQALEAEGVQP